MREKLRQSDVTVVIPHYGDPAPTEALVDSLRQQKNVSSLHIVVVDDSSPIPFAEMEGVTVIRREHNGGFGAAVNSGAAAAKHPLMLILNSDVKIGPRFVSELVSAAAPWQPAVSSPQILGHDGAPQWVGRHFPTIRHHLTEWLTPLARWRHMRGLHEAVGHDTRCVDGTVVPVDWVMGAAMLVPTGEFHAVGGFDEQFFMNSEEVDLQRRLREQKLPSVFIGTVRAIHEGGGSSDSGKRRQWLIDSRMRYAQKWGNPSLLRAALGLATVVNFGFNLIRQAAGRDVSAVGTFWRELGYLRRNF